MAQGPREDFQRRESLLAEIANIAPDFEQRLDQIADRPLMHARHAREPVMPTIQSESCSQRAKRGAGIAEKQVCGKIREAPPATRHDHGTGALLECYAQQDKRVQHARNIVRLQQIAYLGYAVCQCSEQQGAIGNALRARQAHAAPGAGERPEIKIRRELPAHHFTVRSQALRAARAESNICSSAAPSPRSRYYASRLSRA